MRTREKQLSSEWKGSHSHKTSHQTSENDLAIGCDVIQSRLAQCVCNAVLIQCVILLLNLKRYLSWKWLMNSASASDSESVLYNNNSFLVLYIILIASAMAQFSRNEH